MVFLTTTACHRAGFVDSTDINLPGVRSLDSVPELLTALERWGRFAASAYQRFEDWSTCTSCQHPDIRDTQIITTWSTIIPAFSRGYVGVHQASKQIVIVFRGSTHVLDAVTDTQIVQTPWPRQNNTTTKIPKVHSGFLLAYQAARPHVFAALRGILRNGEEFSAYSLHFVGHSLGAAQSALAFVDWRLTEPDSPNLCQLVTMGSPRIGNPEFANLLNSLSRNSNNGMYMEEEPYSAKALRVVHGTDIVVHFPRSMLMLGEYAHSGLEIWARDDDDGVWDLVVCRQDRKCSASVSPIFWNINDHLVYPGMRLGIPQLT
ncbi:hypothetical protein IWW50_000154 [Coemansia erecta]|nr:hypothetical protein IWW50_000154 [Coemansia erecta]